MKKYYIHRFYKTPISLSQNRETQQKEDLSSWSFNFPKEKVSICIGDELKEIDGKKIHFGLTIIAEVFADSEEDAISMSMMYSEAIMNMFVFSTLSVSSAPKVISIICFEKSDCSFKNNAYAFNPTEAIIKIVPIEFEKFDQIYKGCNRIVNSERTMRAMSWLRKGINEKNSIDKFISFWVGLEVLKGIFPKTNEVAEEKEPILRKVRSYLSELICGKHRNIKINEWKDIDNIFIEKLERNDFKKIKQARSAILHGFGELSPEFHKQIDEYWSVVRNALIWSLGIIVGLDDNIIKDIIVNEKKSYLGIRYTIGGKIEGLSGELKDDFKNFPRIDLAEDNVESTINKNGEIDLKHKTTFKTHGATDKVKWKLGLTEIWGE